MNVITIGSFIFYAIGIYIQVAIQGITWGNVVVNFALHVLGNALGVVMVAVIGACILLALYLIPKFHVIDVFLCWFWILSLYQCAINSFLQFFHLPDEPINQFFKMLFPSAWYPVKEIAFIVISICLTMLWMNKVWKRKFQRYEVILIVLLSVIMIISTALSQVMLMNA
ncbi:MAG TPA: hypothetical protein VKM55_12555 [Candidatus Lokiarchaeia archaeon]|nr:hypothetical protein [Candidatus Lokiarchaeia archaeon]